MSFGSSLLQPQDGGVAVIMAKSCTSQWGGELSVSPPAAQFVLEALDKANLLKHK